MGYYIEVPRSKDKANQLAGLHGAVRIPKPRSFSEVPGDKALICVIDNGAYEAAGFAYSEAEFMVFANPDGRPKTWMLMDLQQTKKLTHFGR